MKATTFTKTGAKASAQTTLSKDIFEVEATNHELMHQAHKAYDANRRPNSAKARIRAEVRGGGRKPWRQKGTGRARHGSIRSPLWKGGGVTFGPTGIENYSIGLNKKQLKVALKQALSLKATDGKLTIIEAIELKDHKTKGALALLDKLKLDGRILLVDAQFDDNAIKAFRNIDSVNLKRAADIHTAMVLDADNIVMSKDGLKALESRLDGTAKPAPAKKESK